MELVLKSMPKELMESFYTEYNKFFTRFRPYLDPIVVSMKASVRNERNKERREEYALQMMKLYYTCLELEVVCASNDHHGIVSELQNVVRGRSTFTKRVKISSEPLKERFAAVRRAIAMYESESVPGAAPLWKTVHEDPYFPYACSDFQWWRAGARMLEEYPKDEIAVDMILDVGRKMGFENPKFDSILYGNIGF